MRKKYDLSVGDPVKIYVNNVVYQLPITGIEQYGRCHQYGPFRKRRI